MKSLATLALVLLLAVPAAAETSPAKEAAIIVLTEHVVAAYAEMLTVCGSKEATEMMNAKLRFIPCENKTAEYERHANILVKALVTCSEVTSPETN